MTLCRLLACPPTLPTLQPASAARSGSIATWQALEASLQVDDAVGEDVYRIEPDVQHPGPPGRSPEPGADRPLLDLDAPWKYRYIVTRYFRLSRVTATAQGRQNRPSATVAYPHAGTILGADQTAFCSSRTRCSRTLRTAWTICLPKPSAASRSTIVRYRPTLPPACVVCSVTRSPTRSSSARIWPPPSISTASPKASVSGQRPVWPSASPRSPPTVSP